MCACFLSPARTPSPANVENSSGDQRQACKKHELYVSFRDLGWQVRTGGRIGPDGGGSGVGVPAHPQGSGAGSRVGSEPCFSSTSAKTPEPSVLTRVEKSG